MWSVKRRQKLAETDRAHIGIHLVERLNVAGIAGLSVAMTGFLWANRLLPQGLAGRADWEIHVFFIVWAAALLHAVLRPARKAWTEQLWIAAALLALLPILNAVTTERPLWHSLAGGDWVFAGMDLMFWVLAALHAALAIRIVRNRPGSRRRRREPVALAAGQEGAA
jgi:hypothetical protein